MGLETVPHAGLQYYLVAFDEQGRERQDDPDGLMSERLLQALAGERVTDIFIACHGWKGDIPAAREQFGRWIAAMAGCKADVDRMKATDSGFRPLIVGLHWPSLPWGDEGFAPQLAFALGAEEDLLEKEIDECAPRIADTSAARAALRVIFEAALDDVAPNTLPAPVVAAYEVLNREAGLKSEGVSGAPGADREPFDPEAAYQLGRSEPESFGEGPLSGILSPLVQLSFWKMKDRARLFGESGAFSLLSALCAAARPEARIHVMGHSFGCIVVSAMLAGPAGSRLPRQIDSALLVQGALSLWSYSSDIVHAPGQAGYFRRVIADGCVRGPIITTFSEHDTAVGRLYPLAAGVAGQVTFGPGELPRYGGFGTFGARGAGVESHDMEMLGTDQHYAFDPGAVYNLESSKVIRNGGGLSGAHSDIAHPEVAHALWSAAIPR